MKNIQKIHEEVFKFLDNWSQNSRITNNVINPYFYMRSVRDDRFKNGYWFPGNDSYLCISFWAGGDSNNKTPNIYFEIHEKSGCRIIIVAKDSPEKYSYFLKLVDRLNDTDNLRYTQKKGGKMWIKQFSKDYKHWQNDLDEFLISDKILIDEYLNENEPKDLEEFISKFGFISANDFDSTYSKVLKERDIVKENEHRRDVEFLIKPKLPFALLGIGIENFQGIKNSSISELPPDARWIFITGENGYGKTTLLQAIALGLSSDLDLEKYLELKSRISVELIYKNEKAFPVRTKGNKSDFENYDYGQFVLGYGPARLNNQTQASENKESLSGNNVLSLFDNETLLKNINYELFASKHLDLETFEDLQQLIKTVTKGRISEIVVVDREAQFVEVLSNGDKLDPMPLSKLAAGFRSIINIVFDIYLRFRKVHSGIKYSDYYGIVLIDEIENHLHPILQRELPITLSEVFPKIQFIISTHSPIPLLGADKNSIILKVDRFKNEGVLIERLDEIIDFASLLPNTILTSPIFGFQNILPENKDDDQFIRVETTYDEVISNDEQRERIEKHLTKETASEIYKFLKKK